MTAANDWTVSPPAAPADDSPRDATGRDLGEALRAYLQPEDDAPAPAAAADGEARAGGWALEPAGTPSPHEARGSVSTDADPAQDPSALSRKSSARQWVGRRTLRIATWTLLSILVTSGGAYVRQQQRSLPTLAMAAPAANPSIAAPPTRAVPYDIPGLPSVNAREVLPEIAGVRPQPERARDATEDRAAAQPPAPAMISMHRVARALPGPHAVEARMFARQISDANDHAGAGRWSDARRIFADALRRDPGHPDVAYNLAVACDRLGAIAEARERYAQALDAAKWRSAAFPVDAARRRLESLAR